MDQPIVYAGAMRSELVRSIGTGASVQQQPHPGGC